MSEVNDTISQGQFGPWKMTPTMKAVHDYMKNKHVGVENRGGMWDIAAGVIRSKNQEITNAKHNAHFEALQRLADNGLVKTDMGGGGTGSDEADSAWIPVAGEKTPKQLYMEELERKFGGA
jgi:hypothetical protein